MNHPGTAFDAEKEVEALREPDGGKGNPRAFRQLLSVMICTFLAAAAAFAVIAFAQSRSPGGLDDDALVEWDGKTFERVQQSADIAALGIATPLSSSECGSFLTSLDKPSSLKGSSLYRSKSNSSPSLVLADKQGQYYLFEFCYFTDPAAHAGQDVLDLYGEGTSLSAIDCYGVDRTSSGTGDWENSIADAPSLARFEQSFGALTPKENAGNLQKEIDASNAWDALITVRYKNGVTFNLCIYRNLHVIAGFRSLYDLPDDLSALFSKET